MRDGQPCGQPGCLHHVTHPCEGCGRIAGRSTIRVGRAGEEPGEYVGRAFRGFPHSPLGNPFSGPGAVDRYREYLQELIRDEDPLVCRELRRLRDIADRGELVLLCWCRQRPCHAEVIAKVLMNCEALRS